MTIKPSWSEYPYSFNPEKTLTTKEITEVLRYLFYIKPLSSDYVGNLPEDIQKHFTLRDNLEEQPTINDLKGTK